MAGAVRSRAAAASRSTWRRSGARPATTNPGPRRGRGGGAPRPARAPAVRAWSPPPLAATRLPASGPTGRRGTGAGSGEHGAGPPPRGARRARRPRRQSRHLHHRAGRAARSARRRTMPPSPPAPRDPRPSAPARPAPRHRRSSARRPDPGRTRCAAVPRGVPSTKFRAVRSAAARPALDRRACAIDPMSAACSRGEAGPLACRAGSTGGAGRAGKQRDSMRSADGTAAAEVTTDVVGGIAGADRRGRRPDRGLRQEGPPARGRLGTSAASGAPPGARSGPHRGGLRRDPPHRAAGRPGQRRLPLAPQPRRAHRLRPGSLHLSNRR